MQVSQEVNDHLSGECISFKRKKDIGLFAWFEWFIRQYPCSDGSVT